MEFLAFEFELSDPIGPTEQVADCLLNVVAEFRLFVGNTVLYRDLDFPIVELVTTLPRWCEHVEESGQPFCFDSCSSALRSLFRIFRGAEGWHLGSIQQDLPSPCVFPLQQVLTEVRRFIAEVEAAVLDRFGFSALALRR